ncbi:MAG TPA: SLC13 family permease [Gemmatimonadales bacterium]
MTGPVLLTLAITLGALGLFLWNRLRADVVGLLVMAALMVTGLVSLHEGISGFANEAMLTVAAMFILSAGLARTGAIDLLGRRVARLAGKSEFRLLLVSLVLVIPLSAFVNNTPVVAVMIPVVLGVARKTGARPSKLLMPISFASQMGGTLTLIGTSTNLLVAGLVLELGLERIRLFDITTTGLVLMAVGVAYLLTAGRWLTPVREPARDLAAAYELREYLTALEVQADSPLVGRTLGESRFASEYGLEVVAVDRTGSRLTNVGGPTVIHAADVLLVRGKIPDIARIENVAHLTIASPKASLAGPERGGPEGERHLAELIVPPRSPVIGRTLRELDFRYRYGPPVIGILRHGTALRERLRDVRLASGDLLLVQGTNDELRRIHGSRDLALLGAVDLPATRGRKLKLAVAIVAAVVLLAAFNVMPIMVSALLGVIAMFLTGCVTPEEAYQEVDWMVLVLLGTMIPLGIAMQNTGAAELVARYLVRLTTPLGAVGTLAAFFLFTSLLTGVISNNAAAVVLTPIAIATGLALDVSPLPFVIAVMIAASNSFLTPIGYQTNTFVFGPGGYRFGDFVRVGGPLNLLMVLMAALVIPRFFPF